MPAVKWSEEFYVAAFEAAKDGLTLNAIARRLGVQWGTFVAWMQRRPALKKAVERGRERAKPGARKIDKFRDLILGKCSEGCQEIWDKLVGDDKDARAEAYAAMKDGGAEVRRSMFIQALLSTNFSYATAKAALKVTDEEFKTWLRYPGFGNMLTEIQNAKKDFFEGALIDAVMRGETSAVVHVNKTVNRDRGYGEKIEIVDERPKESATTRKEALARLSVEEREQLLGLLRKADTVPDPVAPPALIESRLVDSGAGKDDRSGLDRVNNVLGKPLRGPAKAPRRSRKRPEGVE